MKSADDHFDYEDGKTVCLFRDDSESQTNEENREIYAFGQHGSGVKTDQSRTFNESVINNSENISKTGDCKKKSRVIIGVIVAILLIACIAVVLLLVLGGSKKENSDRDSDGGSVAVESGSMNNDSEEAETGDVPIQYFDSTENIQVEFELVSNELLIQVQTKQAGVASLIATIKGVEGTASLGLYECNAQELKEAMTKQNDNSSSVAMADWMCGARELSPDVEDTVFILGEDSPQTTVMKIDIGNTKRIEGEPVVFVLRSEFIPQYEMIDFVGMTQKEVETALSEQYNSVTDENKCVLKVDYEKKYSKSDKDKGRVVAQNVDAGTVFSEADSQSVLLTLSLGVERVTVPNLKGVPIGKARNILKTLGLKLRRLRKVKSKKYSVGKVVKQSIKHGKKVEKRTVIALVISK